MRGGGDRPTGASTSASASSDRAPNTSFAHSAAPVFDPRERNKIQPTEPTMTSPAPASTMPLPPGIRSRFVDNINGLRLHVLEAGFEAKGRPCLLLLHGFPELAYS